MPGQYYFVEKLKFVEKQLCKLNPSYGKVSHALKRIRTSRQLFLYKLFAKEKHSKRLRKNLQRVNLRIKSN